MVTGMVAIGEESGALPELLDKVAEFFEEDVENTSRNLRAMIEPLALVFVGIVVGGMLIALYNAYSIYINGCIKRVLSVYIGE